MISKTTPPQAYTRETLSQAFDWLKTQPQQVKDKVLTADNLVQAFIHSKKFGSPTLALLDDSQAKLEDFISVDAFKKDLKDLADGLKQFESKMPSSAPPPSPTTTARIDHQGETMPATPPHSSVSQNPWSHPQAQESFISAPSWDEKSLAAIRTTKERFNLSSEQEAARMLIAAGFDRLKESFPRTY